MLNISEKFLVHCCKIFAILSFLTIVTACSAIGESDQENFYLNVTPNIIDKAVPTTLTGKHPVKEIAEIQIDYDGSVLSSFSDENNNLPSWLNIRETVSKNRGTYKLNLTLPDNAVGIYETELNIRAFNAENGDEQIVIVPIKINVPSAPIPYAEGGISETIGTNQFVDEQQLPLDLTGLGEVTWKVTLQGSNAPGIDWITLGASQDEGGFSFHFNSALPSGLYRGNLLIEIFSGGQVKIPVPIVLNLTPTQPEYNFFKPIFAYRNETTPITLFGKGLKTENILQITIDGQPVEAFEVLNDYEVSVTVPAITETGEKTFKIQTNLNSYEIAQKFLVREHTTSTAQQIMLPENVRLEPNFVFDYIFFDQANDKQYFTIWETDLRTDVLKSTFSCICFKNGEWHYQVLKNNAGIDRWGMMPDRKQIVVAHNARLVFIDLSTFNVVREVDLPNPDIFSNSKPFYTTLKHVIGITADGKLLLNEKKKNNLTIYDLANGTFTDSGLFAYYGNIGRRNDLMKTSSDGRRTYYQSYNNNYILRTDDSHTRWEVGNNNSSPNRYFISPGIDMIAVPNFGPGEGYDFYDESLTTHLGRIFYSRIRFLATHDRTRLYSLSGGANSTLNLSWNDITKTIPFSFSDRPNVYMLFENIGNISVSLPGDVSPRARLALSADDRTLFVYVNNSVYVVPTVM